jgi:hypothetical protein
MRNRVSWTENSNRFKKNKKTIANKNMSPISIYKKKYPISLQKQSPVNFSTYISSPRFKKPLSNTIANYIRFLYMYTENGEKTG